MAIVRIAEKRFTGFGNDAKKIYWGFGKDRGGDCCRCLVGSEGAKEICAGTAR